MGNGDGADGEIEMTVTIKKIAHSVYGAATEYSNGVRTLTVVPDYDRKSWIIEEGHEPLAIGNHTWGYLAAVRELSDSAAFGSGMGCANPVTVYRAKEVKKANDWKRRGRCW